MSRVLATLFREETVKSAQVQLLHLITVEIPNQAPLRIVDNNEDVTYGDVTYIKFPVKFNSIEVSSDGTINKASVVVANPDRTIQFYVEQYSGLRNCRVSVKAIYAKFLDYPIEDPSQYIEDEYVIDSYTANESTIQFQLEPVIDLSVKLPRRRYTSNSCYWRYKDTETCGYTNSGHGTVDSSHPNTMTYSNSILYKVDDYILLEAGATSQVLKITAVDTVNSKLTFDSNWAGSIYLVTISFKNCNKTLLDCEARGNQVYFGGFPGISDATRRLYL